MNGTAIWQDQHQELGAEKHDQSKKSHSKKKSPKVGHVQCHENKWALIWVRGPNYKPCFERESVYNKTAIVISEPVPASLLLGQLLSHHSPEPVDGRGAPHRLRGCLWGKIKLGCTFWWPSCCYTGNRAIPGTRLGPSQIRNIRAASAHKTASLVSHSETFRST